MGLALDQFSRRASGLLHACVVASIWLLSVATPAISAPNPKTARAYELLDSSSFKVRVKAIQVIAKSGDPNAGQAIRALLKDADPTVRAAAAEALGKLGDDDSMPELIKLLTDDSPLVARSAETAVKALKKKKGDKKGAVKPGRVVVTIDAPQNRTKMKGVETPLAEGARAKLAKATRVVVVEQAQNIGFVVMLTVQAVDEKKQGEDGLMNVTGAATVLELPSRQLKFTTRVTAGVGKTGPLTDADRKELAEESARAAGEALGDELGKWLAKQ